MRKRGPVWPNDLFRQCVVFKRLWCHISPLQFRQQSLQDIQWVNGRQGTLHRFTTDFVLIFHCAPHHISLYLGARTEAKSCVLAKPFSDWTWRLTNIDQLGFVVHGWAKMQLTWIFDGQIVIRTKTVRRNGEEWDATPVPGVDTIISQVFGHWQVRYKQTVIPLRVPAPQAIDENAEAVGGYVSNGYSPSERIGAPDNVQGGGWFGESFFSSISCAATNSDGVWARWGCAYNPSNRCAQRWRGGNPFKFHQTHTAGGPLPGERLKA